MAEEMLEEVMMEVEAVEAVYGDDCIVLDRFPPHLHIHIKPRTADVHSQQVNFPPPPLLSPNLFFFLHSIFAFFFICSFFILLALSFRLMLRKSIVLLVIAY